MERDNRRVVTGRIRMDYVNIFYPGDISDGGSKYSLCVLISKEDKETLEKINNAIEWCKNIGAKRYWNGIVPENLKMPLRDGDTERDDIEDYLGHYFLNAVTRRIPQVVDSDLESMTFGCQDEVTSGCYGRVSLVFYPYSKGGKNGIGCGLGNVQKLADGKPIFRRTSAKDDFS